MPKRRSKRRRKKRGRGLGITLLLLLFLVGLFFLSRFLLFSDYFVIKTVSISENKILSDRALKSKVELPLGENLFRADLRLVESKFEKLNLIQKVRVQRRLPDQIKIHILERKPIMVILAYGKSYVIDKEGVILNIPDSFAGEMEKLSTVKVPQSFIDLKSKRVKKRSLQSIQAWLSVLEKGPFSERFILEIGEIGNATVLIDDVLEVRLGFSNKIEEKFKVLERMLREIKDRKNDLLYLDLSYYLRPALCFR